MRERRKEQRWPAYMGGRASFLDGQATADVLIRDTSSTGGRLVVHNGRLIPDQFNLAVTQWETEVGATVRWRRQNHIGIDFEPAEKDMPGPTALARRVRQLESKNRHLKRRIAELTG